MRIGTAAPNDGIPRRYRLADGPIDCSRDGTTPGRTSSRLLLEEGDGEEREGPLGGVPPGVARRVEDMHEGALMP